MPKRKDKEEEEDATDPKTVAYWDKLKKGEGNLVDAELKKADSVLILKWFTKGSNAAWKFFKRVYLKKPNGKAGSVTKWAYCVTKWAYCVNDECASECRFLQAPRSTTSGLENHPCNKEKIAQKKKDEKAKKASKDAKGLVKSVKSTKIGEIKTLLKESVVDMTIEHGTSFRLAEGNVFAKVVQCGARVGHILANRSGHNMDFLVQSERCIRMTAVCLRIRLYESNDLYEAANPCTFLVGSPVLELKYSYCVQIFCGD